MKKVLFPLLIIGYLLSCGSKKSLHPLEDSISIRQVETNLPVIIRVNLNNNDVFGADFPLVFEFRDNHSKDRNLSAIGYFYRNIRRGEGGWVSNFSVYQKESSKLRHIGPIFLERTKELERGRAQIVIYTNSRSDILAQEELKSYVEQVRQRGTTQGTDTLSVGTFREFRERHPELVKTLLEGDSIRFDMWGIGSDFDCPKRMALDTLIVLPIKLF